MKKSLESILTRIISIFLKFILLTFLTRELSLSDFGYYQLISYFIMISVYIYGVEYYMYGNREVAKSSNYKDKLQEHISFFLTFSPVSIVVQLILIVYLLPNEIINITTIGVLLFVNFCDYFNQEVYRYLVILKKIRRANLLLIVKSGALLFFIISYYFFQSSLDIEKIIFLLFLSYTILLVITTSYFVSQVVVNNKVRIVPLPFWKFKKTFTYLMPFIILMIFSKGLEFFDKFALEYFFGPEEVGVYSFLFSIASLIYLFITSGFYIIYLPDLINKYENKSSDIKEQLVNYSKSVILFSCLLVVGIIIGIKTLLNLIQKEELIENLSILYVLLASFFLLNLTTIPKMLLYIAKKDKLLTLIHGFVFLINVCLNILLLKSNYIMGAAIALIVSYGFNLVITFYFGFKEWKKIR